MSDDGISYWTLYEFKPYNVKQAEREYEYLYYVHHEFQCVLTDNIVTSHLYQ